MISPLVMTDQSSLVTVVDWLRWTFSRFNESDLCYGHGYPDAWSEAVFLISQALSLPFASLRDFDSAHVTLTESKWLADLIEKRIVKRIPSAYLVNTAWFCQLPFYVDERVLIPRSPIAELITNRFSPWLDDIEVHSILDLCCGSGCLGLASAHYYPEAQIDLIDISEEALSVASINIDRADLWDRVNLMQADLLTELQQEHSANYALIVCNPPYVSEEEMSLLPQEYQYEPAIGLTAGEDGLQYVHAVFQYAAKHLTDSGILVLEVGNSDEALIDIYPDIPFIWPSFEQGGYGVLILHGKTCRQFFN
ncbi:MAG: 50S ribosomal protein L3 N(5)-glutamine methyltransferase [Endozoicomonadaceae bacterium]|nr:50S ribosomal protein L3 N(5)-glutamine methyltransferase [Endozoicomonadaceae bacterium]MBE8232215.1 50S ribosomal protein L3 N(5)-glutamine methyltransferase [Endozoicomonadaceae bacterium]